MLDFIHRPRNLASAEMAESLLPRPALTQILCSVQAATPASAQPVQAGSRTRSVAADVWVIAILEWAEMGVLSTFAGVAALASCRCGPSSPALCTNDCETRAGVVWSPKRALS